MIGFLSGKILESTEGRILLGVGSPAAGMVGYLLQVPTSSEYLAMVEGSDLQVFVYTNVREDALDLYGFRTREEKELFYSVIQVNGIGPRVGLGIISAIDAPGFVEAILGGDKALLTRIPGVGKKTAERMVLELADPIKKKFEAGLLGARRSAVSGSGAKNRGTGAMAKPDLREDARDALLGLGYRDQQISVLLDEVFKEAEPNRVEDVVRAALKQLTS